MRIYKSETFPSGWIMGFGYVQGTIFIHFAYFVIEFNFSRGKGR